MYVSAAAVAGQQKIGAIPERRPPPAERQRLATKPHAALGAVALPVWRCKVCGYLCARDSPPEVCPICKAKKDRFELFIQSG